MTFLNSTIHTLARASTAAVRPAFHVPCKAIALCLKFAVLKPACQIACLLMSCCLLHSWVKGIFEHGLQQNLSEHPFRAVLYALKVKDHGTYT